ncbi:hypothetical protein [Terribacillus sp. DMT04]|uniref:hypothetical protein n=1 Tax=Terribacillus sp. DMT04 TaxID=2850441 RepID=UPI001C2C6B56|nr:hypothetical protein [Terribacillus sp. DMT04]QXE03571.1 hypothetical protein KS242_17440 [Terribacillus sp. DMT04]
MQDLGRFRETLENHALIVIVGVAVASVVATWLVSENIRVNPIQGDLDQKKEKIVELEKKIEEYEEQVELGKLIVYEETWHKVGDTFTVVEGQVSIKVKSAYNMDDAEFVVDAPGYELQVVEAGLEKRATFNYDEKQYLINITDDNSDSYLDDDEIKISISELIK